MQLETKGCIRIKWLQSPFSSTVYVFQCGGQFFRQIRLQTTSFAFPPVSVDSVCQCCGESCVSCLLYWRCPSSEGVLFTVYLFSWVRQLDTVWLQTNLCNSTHIPAFTCLWQRPQPVGRASMMCAERMFCAALALPSAGLCTYTLKCESSQMKWNNLL